MKTKIALIATLALSGFILMQCGDDKPDGTAVPVTSITPVPLPTNIVPGFHFPEDSNAIYKWLGSTPFDDASIYAHAWGIWAGLTANTNQVYGGDTLRVFETWPGIQEIQNVIASDTVKANQLFDFSTTKKSRTTLETPSQLRHVGFTETVDSSLGTGNNLFVSVSYNVPAAQFAVSKLIMQQAVLDGYYSQGAVGRIPAFPSDAITLKPTYFAGKADGNLVRIPVWHGEPATPQPYGFGSWDTYVFADTTNSQQPGKAVTPVTSADTTDQQIAGATCNLSDFIYYNMDSAMAAYVNKVQGTSYAAGDVAILVCMHVATKEISNWTWQSFYWDPNPSQPKFPGTNLSKPTQLHGPAAHYSAATAYAMLAPNQPITGGHNDALSMPIFGYNPYLEAGFNPATFSQVPNKFDTSLVYGMQTNCMSCHAYAAYNPNISISQQQNNPRYSTDQYVDMNDTAFNSWVQLDFAWSIQASIIPKPAAKK